jgi:hypothetical protein
MSEKRSGFLLLALGIIVMVFSLSYILMVFTGQREPVSVISIPAPKIDLSSFVPGSEMLPGMSQTEIEIIPTLQFNKMLNMVITLLMSGFIMSFGFKLASLGVMFIRPIKVDLKQETTRPPSAQ